MSDQDYTYIDSTGVIVADTSTILATVQNEFISAFGSGLIVTPDTPQGVLITGETTSRSSVIKNNAALANQINPNLAAGVFLDAICALTGLQRIAATASTLTATLSGVAGTIIPEGTRARTPIGDIFLTTGAVVIGGGGTITANFESQILGPVACEIGQLSQIVDGILGWETVTNSNAATLGNSIQSDQSLRALRKVTLAGQGVALPEAIISGLYKVPNVLSLTFQENVEATTQVINGITMVAHSVYACVDGGTDTDVATSLLANKSLGAGWNGSTEIDIVEPYSGQTYTVKFDRPTGIPINVRATVTNTDLLIDATTAVKSAILAYAAGTIEGEPGLVVGQDVSAFELAGAINIQYPSIFVSNLEISDDGGYVYQNAAIVIGVNEIATISSANITVITS